jgi:hypothetical protein
MTLDTDKEIIQIAIKKNIDILNKNHFIKILRKKFYKSLLTMV